jgi:hypothetical protein
MAKYELSEAEVEAFYARVKNCSLKPTDVLTVWQTLDEQDTFYVPDPTTKDPDERESYLENLEMMTAKPDKGT